MGGGNGSGDSSEGSDEGFPGGALEPRRAPALR
jgi:hypothetical protein